MTLPDPPETPANTPRLMTQKARVKGAMESRWGRWVGLSELARFTGDPEASVSARLRDIRRELLPEGDILRCKGPGGHRMYCLVYDHKKPPKVPAGYKLSGRRNGAAADSGETTADLGPSGSRVSSSRSNPDRVVSCPPQDAARSGEGEQLSLLEVG